MTAVTLLSITNTSTEDNKDSAYEYHWKSAPADNRNLI